MAQNVLEKVLQRCESALRARIPIIYIKTESDMLINQIVDSDRLVVRIRKIGAKGKRPEREYRTDGTRVKEKPFNHITQDLGQNKSYPGWDYPRICTYKVPKEWKGFAGYEAYIMAHEDTEDPQYDVLQNSVVILYSSQVQLSPMMQAYTEIIDVDYPAADEIRNQILNMAKLYGDDYLETDEAYQSRLCTEFTGLTGEEIDITMRKLLSVPTAAGTSPLRDEKVVMSIIRRRKEQKMETSVLELCKKPSGSIGGMDRLRSWLNAQKSALKNAEILRRKKGILPPKGVLLCGIPGCGKSEAAKLTAQQFGLPLLKMDVGKLMDKYQGESERNMAEALQMAEAMSPCVLWIDELEKGFSGAGGDNDSSSFKRMFATMLGWMQDNTKPVFIFATANNIGGLPKEFFRSGRFDALFAVYLPLLDECVQIFRACMRGYRLEDQKTSLFEEGCDSPALLREVIETCMIKNGRPRIMVGADIKKIINVTVRALGAEQRITAHAWKRALELTCQDPAVSVYGDGEENVDSIAVSYCRMLRKGLQPTGEQVLFAMEDYQPRNALNKEKILVERKTGFSGKYDQALYRLLLERINEMAPDVEHLERRQILMR